MIDLFRRETARVEKDGAQLIQTVRAQIERLAIEGKNFDAHEQRIANLRDALDTAERQLEVALGEAGYGVRALDRKTEALAQTVAASFGGARRAVAPPPRGRYGGGTSRACGGDGSRGGGATSEARIRP